MKSFYVYKLIALALGIVLNIFLLQRPLQQVFPHLKEFEFATVRVLVAFEEIVSWLEQSLVKGDNRGLVIESSSGGHSLRSRLLQGLQGFWLENWLCELLLLERLVFRFYCSRLLVMVNKGLVLILESLYLLVIVSLVLVALDWIKRLSENGFNDHFLDHVDACL